MTGDPYAEILKECQVPHNPKCRKCHAPLGDDGDYIARLCVDCVYDEED